MRTILFSLILGVFGILLPSPVPAQPTGSVQGRVLSRSGNVPLRDVDLCLYPLSGAAGPAPVKSRQDGTFTFVSVPEGRYLVLEIEECTGYGRRASILGMKQDPAHDYPDRLLEVRPGQNAAPIVVHFNWGAIIQGRLLAPNQKPVAGWQVTAYQVTPGKASSRFFGSATDVSAPDGTYQIVRLRPGKYVLAAEPKETEAASPRLSLIRTFYPAAREIEAAHSITISADGIASGIDIAIQEGSRYSIAGVVAQGVAGRPYKIFLQARTGVSEFRTIPVAQDGSFSVADLSPGLYSLELVDAATGLLPSGPSVLAYAEVSVKTEDVRNVKLTIQPPPVVTARVKGNGSIDLAQVRLFLRPTINPTAPQAWSDRGADGTYTFRYPSPEPNFLTVYGLPPHYSIQAIRFRGQPVKDAIIDLTHGGGEIELTVAPSTN